MCCLARRVCNDWFLPLSEPCLFDAVSSSAQSHKFLLLFRFGAVEEAHLGLWWCQSCLLQRWDTGQGKRQVSVQVWWSLSPISKGKRVFWIQLIVYLQWTTVGASAPSLCMCCLTSPLNWIRISEFSGTPWSGQTVKWKCFTLDSSEVCLCKDTVKLSFVFAIILFVRVRALKCETSCPTCLTVNSLRVQLDDSSSDLVVTSSSPYRHGLLTGGQYSSHLTYKKKQEQDRLDGPALFLL